MGTMAMINRVIRMRLSQCPRLADRKENTPHMEKSGSQAPSDAHLASASGKKLGLAGISGGKKKHSKIAPYR